VFPLRLGDSCDSYIIHLIPTPIHSQDHEPFTVNDPLLNLMKVERRVNTDRDALEDERLALYFAKESMNCIRVADCPHLQQADGMETGSRRRGFRTHYETPRPDLPLSSRVLQLLCDGRPSHSLLSSPTAAHCSPCPPVSQRVCSPLVWCNAAPPPLFLLLSSCWQAPAWIMCFEYYLRLQQY
jgi:hypothetical protein